MTATAMVYEEDYPLASFYFILFQQADISVYGFWGLRSGSSGDA